MLLGPQVADGVPRPAGRPAAGGGRRPRGAAPGRRRRPHRRRAGLEQAVDHLVALGHRRIAHIDGGRAPGAAERRRGYREALHRHGLGRAALILPGGLTEDDGAAAARALLDCRDPRPTAVTVFNDRCATGVLDVLARGGRRGPRR